jgi:hypothetical protein
MRHGTMATHEAKTHRALRPFRSLDAALPCGRNSPVRALVNPSRGSQAPYT